MGDFSLRAEQTPPLNAFVRLDELGANADLKGKANLLLVGPIANKMSTEESLKLLNGLLHNLPSIGSLGLELRELPQSQALELRSGQIFLEPALVQAVNQIYTNPEAPSGPANLSGATSLKSGPVVLAANHCDILTLLANLIYAGSNSTPYSMITAAGPPYTSSDLKDNQIILSQWLADDLHVAPGDEVSLGYFDPESGSALRERTNSFRIHSVVPLELPWADRTLMPDFPGIEKAESTSDWEAGFPLVYKVRPRDEDYWKKYRGTPKAFITVAAGQKMWGNRFGNLTAIRFPIPQGADPKTYREALDKRILANLKPEELGLRFEPVREQALKGAEESQDFGQLFLGFSIFLVTAALLLMALLFQFGLEQRSAEVGIFLALGFSPKQVRRMFLGEGAVLAMVGVALGAAGGIAYAKAMLWGLTTIWRDAIGASALHFHAMPSSVIIGMGASLLVAVLTIWLTLRKQGRQPARELLMGGGMEDRGQKSEVRDQKSEGRGWSVWIALGAGIAALGIVGWALATGQRADAEAFFGAGALLLIAGLSAAVAWLGSLAKDAHAPNLTLFSLGVRACARRRKRSVATIALLASGCFLIVAIGVFRLDANQDSFKRSSGTGGFALIGQSTLPLVHDLNSNAGREAFGLGSADLAGVHVVPFRVRQGDEASCLNLNRAVTPRLLGVKPDDLAGRFAFSSIAKGRVKEKGWELLRSNRGNGVADAAMDEVPAIGDANSIEWALHKKVGDTIDYTDESGHSFKLRLVGAVANSILQGNLIVDEAEFIKRFPGESGYRMFLIDAPSNAVTEVSQKLTRALQDMGLELTPAADRLNAFNAVQNTYLGTFQVLGGLGLLLGSAGLGIVVLRNVLERRGEFGLLTAVGFTRAALRNMTLAEHGALLVLGLGLGTIAALVAVLPALLTPGKSLPYVSLGITLAAVIANGLLWTWMATKLALRGNLLQVLRNE
jgi:ABC-type antimicrobial peptide transport system permease subunit